MVDACVFGRDGERGAEESGDRVPHTSASWALLPGGGGAPYGNFREFLQNFNMDANLWFHDTFRGDTILVYKFMDQGVWDGYSLGDLMPYNNWETDISKFTNSPRGVEETVKGLLKFLSRKKRKSPKNS